MRSYDDVAAGYRRALWTVAALNLAYGIVELTGGVLAESQGLKADALDFLGDGVITGLALLAIGRGIRWQARWALVQSVFLGLLGILVLGNTIYRVLVQQSPEAAAMGVLGAAALGVNLLSAALLLPHRRGDVTARAVWLFSRNDALGNLAVIAAAALVAWTGTPWPDLLIAAVIAALFLHSAWKIMRDARVTLETTSSHEGT